MKSKTKLFEELANAMGFFIQKHPPEGFSLARFQICLETGRIEDAIKYLNEFQPPTVCSNCGHSKEDHVDGKDECQRGMGHGNSCSCQSYEATT